MAEACCIHLSGSLLHNLLERHASSLNIFIWAIALCSHAACKNFAGLFAVRFVLGMCEGSVTAGFMIVSSMFYTRSEQTARVGYWCKWCDRLPTTLCALPSNRFNDWSWFEFCVYSASQTLIDVAAQTSSGFISFGSLHIHTGGFEPWKWYAQVRHPANIQLTLTFL